MRCKINKKPLLVKYFGGSFCQYFGKLAEG